MGRHSLVSKLRYTNTWELGFEYPSSLGWFDVKLGMRLPRKSRDKTRTLHACVWCVLCDLIICCVKNMHNMNDV